MPAQELQGVCGCGIPRTNVVLAGRGKGSPERLRMETRDGVLAAVLYTVRQYQIRGSDARRCSSLFFFGLVTTQ